MKERKIFNFESKILKEETIKKFGYDPDTLGNSSSKFIIAICRFCGKNHEIRKGFFIKSGSACHKECKLKEMKKSSPFSDPDVRSKAKKTIQERYGTEFASQNKKIADKISQSRKSKDVQDKIKKTNIERYGVENPFQNEEIKAKIKDTLNAKYGVSSPLQNEEIKERAKKTNIDRYGVDNPMKNADIRQRAKETMLQKYGVDNAQKDEEIKNKTRKSFSLTVFENSKNRYNNINILREKEFWKKLSKERLKDVCKYFDVDYQSITALLVSPEFRDKYYSTYTFPKTQTQKEIKDILEGYGFKVEFNNRSVIAPLELDIYLPEKKIAIEYNGNLWHSEYILGKDAKDKHINKTRLCQEKGIRLFHIFEHQWSERKFQILNFIKAMLSCNTERYMARKCVIAGDECRTFLDDNHIQGYGNRTVKYFNLVHNDQILATMTASRHHRQNVEGNPIILNRLCIKDGCVISGGSSRLFKAFVKWAKEEEYDRILSWSDNCWTNGDIYPVLGFSLEKEYSPDYFYYNIKKHKVYSKQSQKKSNTGCPENITERDWNADRGFYRIWDCGKKLWKYNL